MQLKLPLGLEASSGPTLCLADHSALTARTMTMIAPLQKREKNYPAPRAAATRLGSTGRPQLYDRTVSGQIRVWDRGNMGSGHGWTGARRIFLFLSSDSSPEAKTRADHDARRRGRPPRPPSKSWHRLLTPPLRRAGAISRLVSSRDPRSPGAWIIFWNSVSTSEDVVVDSPPGASNYGIGVTGLELGGAGVWDSRSVHVFPSR